MKKLIFIFTTIVTLTSNAQSYTNYVLGRYLCTKTVWNNSMTTSYANCTCHLELTSDNYFLNCVNYMDSCFNTTWDATTRLIHVNADSTMVGYAPWDCASCADGKLYSNDSIYLKVYYPIPPANNYWKVFTGFKLYSTVGIEEINKTKDELLISPQPASEEIIIQSIHSGFLSSPILYDLKGSKINAEATYMNANTYKLDVRNLSPGLYFVIVQNEKGWQRKKVIVQ